MQQEARIGAKGVTDIYGRRKKEEKKMTSHFPLSYALVERRRESRGSEGRVINFVTLAMHARMPSLRLSRPTPHELVSVVCISSLV